MNLCEFKRGFCWCSPADICCVDWLYFCLFAGQFFSNTMSKCLCDLYLSPSPHTHLLKEKSEAESYKSRVLLRQEWTLRWAVSWRWREKRWKISNLVSNVCSHTFVMLNDYKATESSSVLFSVILVIYWAPITHFTGVTGFRMWLIRGSCWLRWNQSF